MLNNFWTIDSWEVTQGRQFSTEKKGFLEKSDLNLKQYRTSIIFANSQKFQLHSGKKEFFSEKRDFYYTHKFVAKRWAGSPIRALIYGYNDPPASS